MDRRSFFVALGGLVVTAGAASAQDLGAGLGDVLGLGGNAAGAGLGAIDPLGVLGGGAAGGFRLADLMGGEFSIETSRLALERSRSPSIREFAQLETNEQLSITAALGATPGSVPPRPDQQLMVRKLASMGSGRSFDHAYVIGQIKGHQELLSINTQAVNSAAEPAVRRVATVSIPTIQTHLAILRRLRAGLPAV